MSNWFISYNSGKGYIATREKDGKTERYGGYTKDYKACQKIVNGLNFGMIKL